MDVRSLDEMQGVTDEMIRAHMEAEGWRLVRGVWELRDADGRWQGGVVDDDRFIDRMFDQEWIRKLNPRMRKGVPSDAAKESLQNTPWLARDEFGNPRVGFWSKRHSEAPWTFYVQGRGNLSLERVASWSFWPSNAQLDKVPWPERDGVML